MKVLKTKKIKSGIYNVESGKPMFVKNAINTINMIIKKGSAIFGGTKMRRD